ncbi:MAG: hypothetical protein KAX49_20980 [Halanaerobiales bacterium]|nr:hypothetical protein [Halanaerobiales bacterium]
MLNKLNNCQGGRVLLGEDIYHADKFYVVEINLIKGENTQFGIGIISENNGLKPNVLSFISENKIFVGFNSEVVLVDIIVGKVESRISLEYLFHSFFHLVDYKMIIVINEIGAIALTEDGKKVWEISTDIIENFIIENENLVLEFMDDEPIKVLLVNGDTMSV